MFREAYIQTDKGFAKYIHAFKDLRRKGSYKSMLHVLTCLYFIKAALFSYSGFFMPF